MCNVEVFIFLMESIILLCKVCYWILFFVKNKIKVYIDNKHFKYHLFCILFGTK